MRVRTVILLAAIGLALALGFASRALGSNGLETASGLAWTVALASAVSMLPFWNHVLPPLAPMPGLFDPVGEGQRWCTQCGSPTRQEGACEVCAHVPRAPRVTKT